jgi:Flp pilus assembly protein TadG
MMRTLKPLNRQHGLAMVEAAITLPFLIFVMLAATEFTNAFVTHTTLTKAVRDGARHAAEEAYNRNTGVFEWTTTLQDDAKNLVVYGNKAGSPAIPVVNGLTVNEVSVTRLGTSDNIQVSVTYPYSGILGSVLPTFGYGANISTLFNLSATVTMRAL